MAYMQVFQSTDGGASTLNAVGGTAIAVLDTCLVTGFNLQTVTSLTRSGSTVTATTASPHGLPTGMPLVMTIAGATEPEFNGDQVVTVLGTTTFTYQASGSTAAATGTITAKRTPAGFTKVFSGTNKAVYRSNDVTGDRLYLRVDDSGVTSGGTQEVAFRGYETMTDVDTGTGPFPTVAQRTNGVTLPKSDQTAGNTSARYWAVVSDGKRFYLLVRSQAAANGPKQGFFFGDVISNKPGDNYKTLIFGCSSDSSNYATNGLGFQAINLGANNNANIAFFPREYSLIGGSVTTGLLSMGATANYMGNTGMAYPAGMDNGLYANTVYLWATGAQIRGRFPGLYDPLHSRPLGDQATQGNITGLSGRTVWAHNINPSSTPGQFLLDITGPWD